MAFLHPLMLFGALAGILPILFHFIYKKTTLVHPFPAVRFLIRSQKRPLFFSKLEELLLLAIRILIIILISAAFAKPVLSSLNTSQDSKAYITALVIDDSYSMGYAMKKSTAFEFAKKTAKTFIESASVGEQIILIWTSETNISPEKKTDQENSDLLEILDKKEVSYHQQNLGNSLSHATTLLLQGKAEAKRIILLTDLQQNAWTASKKKIQNLSDTMKNNAIDFVIIDMTPSLDAANNAIGKVSLKRKILQNQHGIETSIEVKNYSSKPVKDLPLTLYLNNEKVAESLIQSEPNEKTTIKNFIPLKEPTTYIGKISIDNRDHLLLDNIRHFSLLQKPETTVLVIDGDQRPYFFDNESFYLMNALRPEGKSTSSFKPDLITPDRINQKELGSYDVIVLCNVQHIPKESIQEITRSVTKNGQGVFFTLGSHIEPDRYNTLFKDLLPVKIRGLKKLHRDQFEHVSTVDLNHPLLEIFTLPGSGNFETATFKNYFLVQQYFTEDIQYLLSFSKGAPYLIIGSKGKGKVALITSTIDREWNDLPIQTTFLPLMHQVILYLSNHEEEPNDNLLVGDKKKISGEKNVTQLTVTTPKGKIIPVETSIHDGKKKGTFTQTNYPGVYSIGYSIKNKKTIKKYFTVNIDIAHESDLSRIDENGLIDLLGKDVFTKIPFYPDKDIQKAVYSSALTTHLWISFTAAVLVLLCAESLIMSRVLRRKRQ